MMHMGTYVCTCHMFPNMTHQFYVITFALFFNLCTKVSIAAVQIQTCATSCGITGRGLFLVEG